MGKNPYSFLLCAIFCKAPHHFTPFAEKNNARTALFWHSLMNFALTLGI